MTNANNGNNNSQEVYAILAELARKQLQTENNLQRTQEQIERTQMQIDATQQQLSATQYEVESLTNDVSRVLGRSAILDDVLLEMRSEQPSDASEF